MRRSQVLLGIAVVLGGIAPEGVTVDAQFGGWERAQAVRFANGGTLDQIYQAER